MKMNPSKENLNGCSEQKKNEEEGISSILEEFATYICDKICPSNYTTMTQEEQEQCCAVCKLESYIDRIGQEYDEINTFSKTSAYQLMQKYKNIVLCQECAYRIHEETTNRYYIYSEDYGQEYEELIGKSYSKELTDSELERMTEECLTENPYITGIENFTCTKDEGKVTVSFRLITELGDGEVNAEV